MLAFLLALSTLLAQGVPVPPNQGGTVTGVLRTAAGAPAAGVRVAAQARPEALNELVSSSAFAALVETDAQGRYRLEDIPPGRYYIVAGRVDAPTYYPGTVQASNGTLILITPGATVSSLDFVLSNASIGRASESGGQGWLIALQVRVESGGKIPLFAGGRFPVLRFTSDSNARSEVPLNLLNVTLRHPAPPNPEFRVTAENLPEGYAVKSLTFGSTDLKNEPLRLPAPNAAAVTPVGQTISLVLAPPTPANSPGVHVTGRIRGDAKRSIYISGNPGVVYADGSFEFLGVMPGRHAIVTLDSPGGARSLGATIVVANADLADVSLEELAVPPEDADRPAQPKPANDRRPGTQIPLASIRGHLLDGETHETFNAGKVVINGDYSAAVALDDNGQFQISRLLPGRYVLDAIAFGVGTVKRTIVLDENDANLELLIEPQP